MELIVIKDFKMYYIIDPESRTITSHKNEEDIVDTLSSLNIYCLNHDFDIVYYDKSLNDKTQDWCVTIPFMNSTIDIPFSGKGYLAGQIMNLFDEEKRINSCRMSIEEFRKIVKWD